MKNPTYYCKWCEKYCKSEERYNKHLSTKDHKRIRTRRITNLKGE